MARPLKDGVIYFPKDTDFYSDDKVRILRAEFGAKGMYLLDYILCEIYGKNGYYIKWDDRRCFLVSDGAGCGCSPEFIKEFIAGCLRCSFFDQRVFKVFGVLTSLGVQSRYIRMFNGRDTIRLIKEYCLLNFQEIPVSILNKVALKSVSCKENPVSCKENPDKSKDNSQIKLNEIKIHTYNARARASDIQTCGKPVENSVENSKETGITKEERAACGKLCGKPVENSDDSESIPSIEDIRRLIDKYGYSVDAERFHEYYSKQLYRLKDGSRVDVPRMLAVWNTNGYGKKEERRKDSKSSTDNGSLDTDEFFRLALKKSYKNKIIKSKK